MVREALGLRGEAGPGGTTFASVATDTRSLGNGALFVALVGERFDGHAFLVAARAAGATGAVVRRGTSPVPGLVFYEVDDTLDAYGRLARYRRGRVTGPVVAITGTNGKTSTKELVAAALRTRFRTHATRLNLNNLIGVPQTILEAPDDVEAMVVEAGANQPGELARYRSIIEPRITVITNVSAGHLEGFGSLDGVLREKLALARDVPVAIVGTEPPALREHAARVARRVRSAGLARADVTPDRVLVDADGLARLEIDGRAFTLGLRGRHQAANALLAWAVARELELDLDRVAEALAACSIPGGRGELLYEGGLVILNDCYNANPASFRAVIDLAAALRGGRRLVFVAATMRELGPDSDALHREIAARLVTLAPDLLAAVGAFGPALESFRGTLGDRLLVATDAEAMGPLLAGRLQPGDLVVLKGSRGEALERLRPHLLARSQPGD